MRQSVAAASTTANRWSPGPGRSGMRARRPPGRRRRLALGPVIVVAALRSAELVRPAINRRDRADEVLVRRRGGGLPLERVGPPRVRSRDPAPPHRKEEVEDEDDL